jgi:hypothetical protein
VKTFAIVKRTINDLRRFVAPVVKVGLEEIPEHAAKNGAGKESMAARREWRNS